MTGMGPGDTIHGVHTLKVFTLKVKYADAIGQNRLKWRERNWMAYHPPYVNHSNYD